MRSLTPLLFIPVLLVIAAFRPQAAATPAAEEVAQAPAPTPGSVAHAVARRATRTEHHTFAASLVPAAPVEVAIVPRAFVGALRFTEVRPHGSSVAQGDVIATLDRDALEAQLAAARRATAAAELAQRGLKNRGGGVVAEAESARAAAERALDEAKQDLALWNDEELGELARTDALSERVLQNQIDDATDELQQLELMYKDDELVQATEEIVLRRSRRNLAMLLESKQLSDGKRQRQAALRARATGTRERAVAAAERALASLVVEQQLAAEGRAQALAASLAALESARELEADLTQDLAALTLRAPKAGVLLHGSLAAWEASTWPEHAVGALASPRTGLFLVAEADRLEARFSLPADQRAPVAHGAGARVRPAGTERDAIGRLALARFPGPGGSFEVRVTLDRPLLGIPAGTPAQVSVTGKERSELLLPKSALRGEGGEQWVWVAAADQAYRRVSVSTLSEVGGDVAIEGEVPEGARVLLGEE